MHRRPPSPVLLQFQTDVVVTQQHRTMVGLQDVGEFQDGLWQYEGGIVVADPHRAHHLVQLPDQFGGKGLGVVLLIEDTVDPRRPVWMPDVRDVLRQTGFAIENVDHGIPGDATTLTHDGSARGVDRESYQSGAVREPPVAVHRAGSARQPSPGFGVMRGETAMVVMVVVLTTTTTTDHRRIIFWGVPSTTKK